MTGTGVSCTKEELEQLKALASRGWRPGEAMFTFSVLDGINRDQATVDAKKVCHSLALKHGLPEIPGYYGLDMDGQFMRA